MRGSQRVVCGYSEVVNANQLDLEGIDQVVGTVRSHRNIVTLEYLVVQQLPANKIDEVALLASRGTAAQRGHIVLLSCVATWHCHPPRSRAKHRNWWVTESPHTTVTLWKHTCGLQTRDPCTSCSWRQQISMTMCNLVWICTLPSIACCTLTQKTLAKCVPEKLHCTRCLPKLKTFTSAFMPQHQHQTWSSICRLQRFLSLIPCCIAGLEYKTHSARRDGQRS